VAGRKPTSESRFPRIAREPRLSDKVADLLLETIIAEKLEPGARLPSERELGEQFGVSRTVVREAVRALAAKGVIDVRTGSGLRVAAVDAAAVSESIGLYLRGGSLEYAKVHEVRRLLEIEIAGLAAERASDDQVKSMSQICDRMEKEVGRGGIEAASQLDLEFHRELARSTDNDLYLLLLDSIGESLLTVRRDNLRKDVAAKDALRSHREILEGVEAHDREAAREAMGRHLENVEQHWLGSHPPAAVPG
jgi:GntR family transcriptional regulator, transcriptional repressor for pyruvate dehydrogenase complex